MGNWFAYFALAVWPLIAIFFYKTKSVELATLLTIMGGFLLLPVETSVDLPLIPPLDKETISVLSALFGCVFIAKRRIGFFDNKGLIKLLLIGLILVPVATVLTNGKPITADNIYLRALTFHDTLSIVIRQFLNVLVPFFIGRQFFKSYESQLLFFKVLVFSALLYSIPILIEIRLSPQLHVWVYGYFPHAQFAQQMRFGGFRPVVFIGHGLLVAFYVALAFISSVIVWKNREKIRMFNRKFVVFYLFIILILCKSVAPFIYGFFSMLWIRLLSAKKVMWIAMTLAILSLSYPVLKLVDIFPSKQLVELAQDFNSQRAESLRFRFENEDKLLNKARTKPYFGWGGWGRSRVYDTTGKDISVTDGEWIIQFGVFGFSGFICFFGLIFLTVLRARKAVAVCTVTKEKDLLAAHALIIGIVMIDQLVNASLRPWLWMLIGALIGRSNYILTQKKNDQVRSLGD